MQACSLKPSVQLFSSKASGLQRGTAVAAVQRLAAPAARSTQLVVEGKRRDAAAANAPACGPAGLLAGIWVAHCANAACWTGRRAAGAAGAGGGGARAGPARSPAPRRCSTRLLLHASILLDW